MAEPRKIKLTLEFSRQEWGEIETSLLAGSCALTHKGERMASDCLMVLTEIVSDLLLADRRERAPR